MSKTRTSKSICRQPPEPDCKDSKNNGRLQTEGRPAHRGPKRDWFCPPASYPRHRLRTLKTLLPRNGMPGNSHVLCRTARRICGCKRNNLRHPASPQPIGALGCSSFEEKDDSPAMRAMQNWTLGGEGCYSELVSAPVRSLRAQPRLSAPSPTLARSCVGAPT